MMRPALGLGLVAVISLGAMAQQKEPERIPNAQSPCGNSHEEARRTGRLSGSETNEYGKPEVDENKDGTIGKTEFDQLTPRICPSIRKGPTILNAVSKQAFGR